MVSYCISCRKKTAENSAKLVKTKKGAYRMESMCTCGMKKTRFVPRGQSGGGAVDTFISALPFETHLYGTDEKTGKLKRSSFTGPGTKLERRLGPGDVILPGSVPINAIDRGAYSHDICYRDSTDPSVRNSCDDRLKAIANRVYDNPKETFANRSEAYIVKTAMSLIRR
jgi:hypothetical protein